MNRYAELTGPDANGVRTIANVIEQKAMPDPEHGTWHLCGNAGPGFTTTDDGATFTVPIPSTLRELPKVQYLKRFTQPERIAIRSMGLVNEYVNDYIELMNAAVVVHLDDPDTIDGLHKLELAGAIAPGRAAEIRA